MAYQMPTSSIPLLFDPPFVALLFVLGAALGLRLFLLLGARRGDLSRLEWGVLCSAVGLGALQYIPFVLSAVGQLNAVGIWTALAVVFVLCFPQFRLVLRHLWRALGKWRSWRPEAWQVAAVGVAAVPLGVAFLQALCPCTDVDGMGYHLAAPKRWLQEGTLSYLPSFRHTQTPLGPDMLYLLALGVWSDTAAKLIHFAFGLLAMAGLYALARRMAGPGPALLVSLVYVIATPEWAPIKLMTWANTDMGVVTQLTALVIVWLAWNRSDKPGLFRATMLLAGLLITYKITMGLFVGLLAVVGGVWRYRSGVTTRRTVMEAGLLLGACLLVPMPWFVRSWWLTGNPVWPLASSIFPSVDWDAEVARFFFQHNRLQIWGWGYLGDLPNEQRMWILTGAMVITAVVTLALALIWKHPVGRVLLLTAGLAALAHMWFTGLYLRYLLPLYAPVLACAAAAWHILLKRPAVQWGVVALLAVGGGMYVRSSEPPLLTAARVAAGNVSRDEYLSERLTYYGIARKVNAELPSNAMILGSGGFCQLYFDRPMVYADNARIRCRQWDQFLADVRRSRVTHVLASGLMFDPALRERPGDSLAPFIRRLVAEHGELLVERPDRLYVLSRGWNPQERVF